jgi:hypothetical protein
MFKKMLWISLALVLALGMGLPAVPVLAQGGSSPATGFQSVVPAEIKNVTLLNEFPARIQINGVLPAGCYKLKVSPPVVGKPNPNTSITPITIRVRAVWQRGTPCTEILKRFSTTVTIDPLKLNLAPGRYLVRFNPVNGRTRHKVGIIIPFGLD